MALHWPRPCIVHIVPRDGAIYVSPLHPLAGNKVRCGKCRDFAILLDTAIPQLADIWAETFEDMDTSNGYACLLFLANSKQH